MNQFNKHCPFSFFTLIVFISLLTNSCGKGILGDARADGIVKDKTTNEGISNATVYLLQYEGDGGLIGGGTSRVIDSTTSGNEGSFQFSYDNNKDFSYYISAKANNYFFTMQEIPISDLGAGIDVEIVLDPIAYLQIHFENIEPSLPSDIFGINGYVTDVFYGEDVDTVVIYTVFGNLLNELHWAVGYEPTLSDTIYCPSFDTTYFEILY